MLDVRCYMLRVGCKKFDSECGKQNSPGWNSSLFTPIYYKQKILKRDPNVIKLRKDHKLFFWFLVTTETTSGLIFFAITAFTLFFCAVFKTSFIAIFFSVFAKFNLLWICNTLNQTFTSNNDRRLFPRRCVLSTNPLFT